MVNQNRKSIEAITRDLVLTNEQLEKVSALLLHEFYHGLSVETHQDATVKMFPTYVRDVPNGREKGKFLALDLGGTNFRVLLVELDGAGFKMENEVFAVPQEIMLGPGNQLFDHIASCLASFLDKNGLKNEYLKLGFTFSFPCQQEGLTSARLVTWTKGFKCSGVEGEDVVRLLTEAIKRRGDINIDIIAVVNDTTGTLMSCAHKNRDCRVGLIIGTGTNACYMERMDNVELCEEDEDYDCGPNQMIINTEWGAFDDRGLLDFLRTGYDRELDENSLNSGKQLFEKMISGMYLGELSRLILVHLTKLKLLFGGDGGNILNSKGGFPTQYISLIESDKKHDYTQTRRVLEEIGIYHATDDDCENVKLVCARASTRAAFLVSSAVATILNKIKRPFTTVGVDGSVYRYHPHFHNLMEKKIAELTKPDYKFDLVLSEDGSGRGAALVAAVTARHFQ